MTELPARERLFLIQGDIAQLEADAVVCTTDIRLHPGQMWASFAEHFPDFYARATAAVPDHQLEPGQAVPIPHRPGEPRVVLVAATGHRAHLPTSIENALVTAHEAARDGEPTLVALPLFRFGWGGDRHQRLVSATTQLETALEVLEDRPDLVVSFVAWGPWNYRAVQEAREQLLGPPELEGLDELTRSMASGECVVFVGAGLSREADLPGWGELVAGLGKEIGLDAGTVEGADYLDVAQWYEQAKGRPALEEHVRRVLGAGRSPRPTLAHYALLGNPVGKVITTNYDGLLEETLDRLRRPAIKIVDQREVARAGASNGTYVIKFHGDLEPGAGIVLTRDDYEDFFTRRPAFATLLQGLLLNHTFLFVGYSLSDPNFRQIYHRISAMLEGGMRRAYATDFDGNPHVIEQWDRKGLQLIPIPGEGWRQRVRFLGLLDRLGAAVSDRSHTYLAPEEEVEDRYPHLELVRDKLLEAAHHASTLTPTRLGSDEAGFLLHWLREFARAGHRIEPEVFLRLATRFGKLGLKAQQREALMQALECCGSANEEAEARRLLAELDGC